MAFTPLGGNIYLSFQGVGTSSGHRRSFDVLVGDNPPVITGGYANWTTVKRPLQRALTVFTGYDPTQMTVEVRFGRWDATRGWLTGDAHAKPAWRYDGTGNTADDIATLEWMAGSGFTSGPSPIVYVWSHSTSGGDTQLIPQGYKGLPWIVSSVQWGKSWRNANGYRTWQDATIVLNHYLNLNQPPAPDTKVRGAYVVSKPGRDTALLIAAAPPVKSPTVDHKILAGRILSASHNNPCKGTSINLGRRSVSWQIRHGVSVWCPTHQGL